MSSIRSSSQNSSTTGTAISVSAPAGATTGDVVICTVHGNGQTTIVDNTLRTPSFANLTTGADTDGGASSTTASITPGSNKLILLTVDQRTGITADPNQPTATGNGLTWVVVNSIVYDTTSSSRKRVTVLRALGASPSSGAVTIDFGGQNNTDVHWTIEEVSDTDTSGTNGSGAIVQSVTNKDETGTASSLTVTLAAFSNTANATFGGFGLSTETGYAVGSGFTLGGTANSIAGSARVISEWKASNDTGVDITMTGSLVGGIGIEIKGAPIFTEDLNDYQPNTTSGQTVSVFSRRLVSGDPSTYNFTLGASGRWSVIAVCIQNPDATTIYDVTPTTSNLDSPPGASTASAPSITTTTSNAIHFACAFIDASTDDFTGWASGYTVHQSVDNNQGQTVTSKVIAAAGATGAQSFTHNGTGTAYIGVSFAIKDDGVATGQPTSKRMSQIPFASPMRRTFGAVIS